MCRKIAFSLLLLALVIAGCDSNGGDDNGQSDAEVFVGTWTAVSIEDDDGDKTDMFSDALGRLTIVFEQDGSYSLSAIPDDGSTPLSFQGSYTVDEDAKTLTLNGVLLVNTLTLDYDIESENTIELTADENLSEVFNLAAGETLLNGDVTLTITRQ